MSSSSASRTAAPCGAFRFVPRPRGSAIVASHVTNRITAAKLLAETVRRNDDQPVTLIELLCADALQAYTDGNTLNTRATDGYHTYGRGPHYTNVYSYITRSVCQNP